MRVSDRPVLVVDDDEDVRQMVSLVLEAEGFRVACALDGVEALRWLSAHEAPALILLDLMMPRMDGEAFLSALRARQPQTHIPVVVLSGYNNGFQGAGALSADGRLRKPIELDELLATVHRFVAVS